jgi:hypothetical protein
MLDVQRKYALRMLALAELITAKWVGIGPNPNRPGWSAERRQFWHRKDTKMESQTVRLRSIVEFVIGFVGWFTSAGLYYWLLFGVLGAYDEVGICPTCLAIWVNFGVVVLSLVVIARRMSLRWAAGGALSAFVVNAVGALFVFPGDVFLFLITGVPFFAKLLGIDLGIE